MCVCVCVCVCVSDGEWRQADKDAASRAGASATAAAICAVRELSEEANGLQVEMLHAWAHWVTPQQIRCVANQCTLRGHLARGSECV